MSPRLASLIPRFCAVCTVLLAISCSGGSGATTDETLAPGDARFLLARGNGLEEITLSGQSKRLFELPDKSYVLQPSISPDGKSLAFIVELPARTAPNGLLDFGADLYVSDRDGSNARPVLQHMRVGDYLESPDWLDSGTILVGARGLDVVKREAFSRILKVDAQTGKHEIYLENAVMGAVSRDRKSLVYAAVDPATRVEALTVAELSGRGSHVVVPNTSGLALFIAAAFSPDGSQIAFAAVDVRQIAPPPPAPGTSRAPAVAHPFAQDVWLVKRDGSDLKRLGEIAENMPALTWTGDGRKIYAIGPGFLWRLDPISATAEQVQESGDRAWIVWLAGS